MVGGYHVCHKWLSDRKKNGGPRSESPRPGRVLTGEDVAHYQHDGWPSAFVTDHS